MSHICPKVPHVNPIQLKASLFNIFTRGWHISVFLLRNVKRPD